MRGVMLMNKTLTITDQNDRATGRRFLKGKQRQTNIGQAVIRTRGAIGRWLSTFAEGIAEGRCLSRLYDELSGMSNGQLSDFGLNRTDIPAVVTGTYRKSQHSDSDSTLSSRRERSPSPGAASQSCDQGARP